jgi:hypothetical protein
MAAMAWGEREELHLMMDDSGWLVLWNMFTCFLTFHQRGRYTTGSSSDDGYHGIVVRLILVGWEWENNWDINYSNSDINGWLVLCNMNFMTFHLSGMSSSQLTNSYFSEGLKPPTRWWIIWDSSGTIMMPFLMGLI